MPIPTDDMWRKEFVSSLQKNFEASKKRNPRFSLRAFGKKLGLSAGAVSLLLNNKADWKISREKASEVIERLGLSDKDTKRLRSLMGYSDARPRKTISDDNHRLLADWAYFPILFCFDLNPEERSIDKIAARFKIPKQRAQNTVDDLLRSGLIKEGENGLERDPEVLASYDEIPSEVVRAYHKINAAMNVQAIEKVDLTERDITSVTYAGSKERIKLVKEEIRKFHERIMALSETDNNDEVYRLNISFFPIKFGVEDDGAS